MTAALQWDRDSVGNHPCEDNKHGYPAAPPRESSGEDSEVKDEESELG
jgi:hypothetical protein